MNSITKPTNYFSSLTGIRAFAAFLVYFHHANPFEKGTFLYKYLYEFHVGVTIFFVLSGFLISFKYFEKLDTSWDWIKVYLGNRIIRIFPIYFILTSFTFVLLFWDSFNFEVFKVYLLNITLLKGFFSELKFTGIAQGWSLTVEECFYLAAPFIFFIIRPKRYLLVIIPFFILLTGLLFNEFFSDFQFHGFLSGTRFILLYTFFGRCFEFCIGVQLALIMKNRIQVSNIYQFPKFTYSGFCSLLVLVYILTFLQIDGEFGLYHPMGIVINNIILPVFISFFFYGLILENSFLRKILESRVFVVLGKSSYIFYLIHVGVINSFFKNYITSNLLILFIILNVISILLFITIEDPIHKRLHKMINMR